MNAELLERGTHAGLQYVVVRVPSLALPAVHLTVRGGALHHPASQGQLPHLLEHLAARGPTGEGSAFAAQLERHGVLFNARVEMEFTSYEFRAPAARLRAVVRDATALAFQPVQWTEAHVRTEQQIISSELRGAHGQLAQRVASELQRRLYPELAGAFDVPRAVQGLPALTLADVLSFRAHHHTAGGALLILFTPGEVPPNWMADAFPAPPGPGAPWMTAPREGRGRHVTLRGGRAHAYGTAFHALPFAHPEALALQLSYGLLGYGLGSALYREAVLERGLTYHISTHVNALQHFGHVSFHAGVHTPQAAADLEGVMQRAVEGLTTGACTAQELDRARSRFVTRLLLESERTDLHLARLTKQLLHSGTVTPTCALIQALHAVTPEHITHLWADGRRWPDRVSVTLHAHPGDNHAEH